MAIRYVNTDSTPGGTGLTNATSGTDRAYASLDEALKAEAQDLTVLGEDMIIYVSGTQPDGYAGAASSDGWVTSATTRLIIENEPNSAHGGVWNETVWRADMLLDSSNYFYQVFYSDLPYLELRGLQFRVGTVASPATSGPCIDLRPPNGSTVGIVIDKCIFREDTLNDAGATFRGIGGDANNTYTGSFKIQNSLFYDFNDVGLISFHTGTGLSYCNTFIRNATATSAYPGTIKNVNCVFQNNTTDVAANTDGGSSYCLTDKDGTEFTGSNNVTLTTLTFRNASLDNYHLDSTDTAAIDAGTGPSSDVEVPTYDIDGETRSGLTTDIGFDLYSSPTPATLTVTTDLVTLSDCDSTTGWTGNSLGIETTFYKQGSGCLVDLVAQNPAEIYFTDTASKNLAGRHVRMWFSTNTYGLMLNQASNGLVFFVEDIAGNRNWWRIGGKDTYQGGWINIVVDLENPDFTDATPANNSQLIRYGVQMNFTSKPRRIENTWVDYLRYGSSLTAYGGSDFTLGSYIDIQQIAQEDANNGYGIVEEFNDTYFLSGTVNIGDPQQITYYYDANKSLVFKDVKTNDNIYALNFTGGYTHVKVSNSSIKAAGTKRFDYFANETGLAELNVDNTTFSSGRNIMFTVGETIQSCAFINCTKVYPNLSTFTGCSVSSGLSLTGTLEWPHGTGDGNISSLTLADNSRHVHISDATDKTFNAVTIQDTDTSSQEYAVYNDSGSARIVNLTGGSSIDANIIDYDPAGQAVTFQSSNTITIKTLDSAGNPIPGVEVSVIRTNDRTALVDGVATDVNGQVAYTYSTADVVDIMFAHVNYKPVISDKYDYQLPNVDSTLTVTLFDDNNYDNPP